jgi:hypothetical protein
MGLFASFGVSDPDDLDVTQNGVADMSVNISAGAAYVLGSEDTHQGVYHVYNDASVNRSVQPSSPTQNRIDLVVARVYDAFYSGVDDLWDIEVIEGVAGSGAPDVPDNAIELARISVDANVTSITTLDIDKSNKDVARLKGAAPFTIRYNSAGSFTWNKPPGLRAIKVICCGGGGSGGGCAATGSTQSSEGGGGGGGGTRILWVAAEDLGSTEPVTVGAGGAAASAGAAGNNGGNSDFGGINTGHGGKGGQAGTASTGNVTKTGGVGGTTAGIDSDSVIGVYGDDGGPGRTQSGDASKQNWGGGTYLGGITTDRATGSSIGTAGKQHGGGSTGATNGTNQSARGSTPAFQGVVYIEHYF